MVLPFAFHSHKNNIIFEWERMIWKCELLELASAMEMAIQRGSGGRQRGGREAQPDQPIPIIPYQHLNLMTDRNRSQKILIK